MLVSQQVLAFHLGEPLRKRTPKIRNLSYCYFTAYYDCSSSKLLNFIYDRIACAIIACDTHS